MESVTNKGVTGLIEGLDGTSKKHSNSSNISYVERSAAMYSSLLYDDVPDSSEELDDPQTFNGMDWKNKSKKAVNLPSYHTSFLKQACLFCIPPNKDLLAYWGRVEDRLFKIRNCMNISGVRRQIPLFAPEIDPRLLVRAKAAGLSLEDVLNSINGDLPPYRFAFLLAKAKEYAGALQSFGGALLGALEKKSAEELAKLRWQQQDEILKVHTTKLRDMEVAAAEASLEGIMKKQDTVEHRRGYYQQLQENGLNVFETRQLTQSNKSLALKLLAEPYYFIASLIKAFPGIIGMSNSTGTAEIAGVFDFIASILKMKSDSAAQKAGLAATKANFARREQGWEFSEQLADNELEEIKKQIIAARIRKDISVESRAMHEKSIEHHQEIYEFHRDKFTNHGLYTWLSTQLQRMYRESYQNAMTIARMAEQAYRFERNDDTSVLLKGNYWDASRAGLMAGESLMNALRRMEMRFMETNTRSMEIDQAFSITQIDPAALLNLKTTENVNSQFLNCILTCSTRSISPENKISQINDSLYYRSI